VYNAYPPRLLPHLTPKYATKARTGRRRARTVSDGRKACSGFLVRCLHSPYD